MSQIDSEWERSMNRQISDHIGKHTWSGRAIEAVNGFRKARGRPDLLEVGEVVGSVLRKALTRKPKGRSLTRSR